MCARKFDAARRSISELFRSSSNVKFKIPPYQRDYSWTKNTIDQMWTDLISSFEYIKNDRSEENVRKAEYFFGTIVLVEEDSASNSYFIVDGQQRFATLALLLCAARDIMGEENKRNSSAYHDIRRTLANHTAGIQDTWKLDLNETDKHIFKKLLNGDKVFEDDVETASQKNIYKCYQILKNSISREWQDDFDEEEQTLHVLDDDQAERSSKLNLFIDHVLTNNYVTELIVAHDGNPYQIFEALNGKGQPLTQANRTKNYVLEQVKHDKTQTQMITKQWNKIFNNVVTKGLTADQFLLESFLSRYKHQMRSSNICSRIKWKVSDRAMDTDSDYIGCKQYVNELQEDAEFLSTLNNSNAPISIRADIEAMYLLGAKLIRIPILAAHRMWPEQDYQALVKFLVKFFFKNRTIRHLHTGQIEKTMLAATRHINDGDTLSEIIEALKHYDNHRAFLRDFEDYAESTSKPSIAKYVLRSIDLYLAEQNQRIDYMRDRTTNQLLLEYVLPSKNNQWDEDEFFRGHGEHDYEITDCAYSLGNLTLLTAPLNSKDKIMPFGTKKNHYELSDLEITRQTVCKYDEWTANIIEERERTFVKCADKIWKFD